MRPAPTGSVEGITGAVAGPQALCGRLVVFGAEPDLAAGRRAEAPVTVDIQKDGIRQGIGPRGIILIARPREGLMNGIQAA